jgi:hypothetical protein
MAGQLRQSGPRGATANAEPTCKPDHPRGAISRALPRQADLQLRRTDQPRMPWSGLAQDQPVRQTQGIGLDEDMVHDQAVAGGLMVRPSTALYGER